jgi:hypothetical protein
MGYKFIPVTPEYEIAIPDNLPPDQEAALIAQRLAEFNPVAFAAELNDIKELMAHPERAIPFEEVFKDLDMMEQSSAQSPP